MNANRFYSVPLDGHQRIDVQRLMDMLDGFAAYGRWHALLEVIFQAGGRIELDGVWRGILERELRLDADGLREFLAACAECGMLAGDLLELGVVTSNGIAEQLEFKKSKREAQAKSVESRKANKEKSKE